MASELIEFIARIATIALTPIVLFYAWAAMHSSAAKKSKEYNGSFWVIIIAAVLLSAGELVSVYADLYGMSNLTAIPTVTRLLVFLLLLWKLRDRTKHSIREHLQKKEVKKK